MYVLNLRDLGPWKIHRQARYTDMMAEKYNSTIQKIFLIFLENKKSDTF